MAVLDLLPPIKKKAKKAPKGYAAPAINVPRYQPPLIPSQHPVPARLKQRLLGLGRRYVLVNSLDRIAQYICAAIMLLTVQMFLDWLINLNLFVRALFLAADITLLVYFARKQLLPYFLNPPNLEACALMVEKHWPRFHGRMIATVQFAVPRFTADSPELVRAVQQETDSKTGALNFGEIVPTKSMERRGAAALGLIVVMGGLMYLAAPGSIALLERVFLIPAKVPRKTEVICLTGNKIIPAGDTILLEAQAKGIIPSHGRATLVDDTGRIQEITIDPEPGKPDRFSLKVERVSLPFNYTIFLNDGSAGPFQIKTFPRPNVTSLDCEQVYPPYTGLKPLKRSVGNLALLAGSKLNIHGITNTTITKAAIKLIGLNKTLPVTISGKDNKEIAGSIDIPATDLTGFSIILTDQAGLTSGDETQYQIDLIPDHPPVVQITQPERLEELYTLKAKPVIAFNATDDYGIAKINLCYRVVVDSADTPETLDANGNPVTPPVPEPKRIPMDIGTGDPQNFQNTYEFDLSALKTAVREGMSLEYWMEAQDSNNVTGPGIGESEHHVIKVVTPMEKKAEIMDRMMSDLSNLDDLSKQQDQINQDLNTALRGKKDSDGLPQAPTPSK
jgi:hypothetical protein